MGPWGYTERALCNAESTQRCGRQCAVGRGAAEPVKDITLIPRDLAKPRNAAHKAGCCSEDPIQAFKPTSRESFVYHATVIEARYYKGMNSSWGEGAGHHPELSKLVVTAAAKKINIHVQSHQVGKAYMRCAMVADCATCCNAVACDLSTLKSSKLQKCGQSEKQRL